MKNYILSVAVLALLTFSSSSPAQIFPTVSVQGTNATLRWVSTPGESYLVHYRRAFHPATNLQWQIIGTNVLASAGMETFFQHTGSVPLVPAGVGGGGGGGGGSTPPVISALTTPTSAPLPPGQIKQSDDAFPAFPTLPDEKELEKWLKKLLKEYEKAQREGNGTGQTISALMVSTLTAEQATSNSMGFYAVTRATDDTDGDGLPDAYEVQHGFKPFEHDSLLDADGDGWSNLDEYLLGMNPLAVDAGPSTFAVVTSSGAANETGPTSGTFTVSRTGDLTRAVTVYLGWGGTARAGRDYARLTNEFTFAAGQSSVVLTVVPVDDAEFEGTETVTLKLYPDLAYQLGANAEATLNLLDNDLPGVIVVATKPSAAEAGLVAGEFEFRRTGSTAASLTVNFNLTGSTATVGTDFNAVGNSIIIPAGASVTNLLVTPVQDAVYEGPETIVLNLTDHASYSVSNRTAIVTLADDDLPMVTVVATDADARELGANPGTFTFTRTGSTAAPLRIDFGIGGTATNGVDYQTITNFVTIPAGAASTPLAIVPLADTNVEFLEFVTLTVRGSDAYDIGAANSATVLIDDTNAPAYNWRTLRSAAVVTNNPAINVPALVEIYRTGSVLGTASFPFNVTTNGQTANPAHYTVTSTNGVVSGSSVVLAVGRTNALLEVRPTDPSPLTGTGSGVNLAIPLITGGGAAQIHFLPSPYYISSLAWTTTEAVETGGVLTLRASRPVLGPAVTIPILLSGLSIPGFDHTAPAATTLTIPANQLSGDLIVTALSDVTAEGWESVVASINAFSPGSAPAAFWRPMSFIRENVADLSFLTDGDTDGDGLPDRWEIQYGYDPTVADDVTLDADKDGLNLADEFLFGTHPTNAATFGPNDYRYSRVTNTVDSVPLRLIVGDTGKHNNGQGCAQCHVTGLQVGPTKFKSPTRAEVAERLVNFEKGKSYPVRLLDLLGVLPPATGNNATPTTTAKYTAQILPADPAAPTLLLTDPQAILGTNKTWTAAAFTNTNAVVIVPKLQLSWTHVGDNLPIETNTVPGTNTLMPGGGFRVFVGAKTPSEADPRNTVILKVKSIPALPGRTVYLKAFDVDDATDPAFDLNNVVDPNGPAGNDNFPDYLGTPLTGAFGAGTLLTNSVVLNASGEALVQFRVGMQPGNNYRIAATVQATNNLASLQVTSPTNTFFVTAGTNAVANFNGDVSPMLTVWRKLHLEIDSMGAVPLSGQEKNLVQGKILGTDTTRLPAGQTRIYLANDQLRDRNRFENGTLYIEGLSTAFNVLGNSGPLLGTGGSLVIQGTLPPGQTGKNIQLFDDDDQGLAEIGVTPLPMTPRSEQIVAGMQPAFLLSYVRLVNANSMGWNTRPQFPFRRNEGISALTGGDGGHYGITRDIGGTQPFWASTVSFGYQSFTDEDRDSSDEAPKLGVTAERKLPFFEGGISAIFVETIREAATDFADPTFSNARRSEDYWAWVYGITAHEIAHLPGGHSEPADHAEEGIMVDDGNRLPKDRPEWSFTPRTITRIRSTPQWNP